MTTEQKALALVNAEQEKRGFLQVKSLGDSSMRAALIAAIEAHEADKKAFSDAVKRFFEINMMPDSYRDCLSSFILPEPEPDPLVEAEDPIDALVDLLAPVLTHSQGMAARERENRFRNAMATIMAKIERIEQ